LNGWLSGKFDTAKMHMGKPAWSLTTTVIRGVMKIGSLLRFYRFEGDLFEESFAPHGYPWFIRAACTARDRFLTYILARRLSSNGGVVLCDRYPLTGLLTTDGPQCECGQTRSNRRTWFHRFLTGWETSYYRRIQPPDLLIVLKVDPELAVHRKVDETELSVRSRSTEVWELDWSKFSAKVIDAGRPKAEVVSEIKDLVWTHL
jgi:hypothetical protein